MSVQIRVAPRRPEGRGVTSRDEGPGTAAESGPETRGGPCPGGPSRLHQVVGLNHLIAKQRVGVALRCGREFAQRGRIARREGGRGIRNPPILANEVIEPRDKLDAREITARMPLDSLSQSALGMVAAGERLGERPRGRGGCSIPRFEDGSCRAGGPVELRPYASGLVVTN